MPGRKLALEQIDDIAPGGGGNLTSVEETFSYDAGGTVDFDDLEVDDSIVETRVVVEEAFNEAATLQVGTLELGASALLPASASNLRQAGTYCNPDSVEIEEADNLRYVLSPGTSSTGSGRIIVIIRRE